MGAARAWVGTSGWTYQHWKGVFYPAGVAQRRWLEFYARHFDTVEVNASFYRLPTQGTFAGWCQRTPEHFRFCAKASRLITHLHRLKNVGPAWGLFWDHAQALGEKLACILVQLPPGLPAHPERLEEFCRLLPGTVRFAFEFRHGSWFSESIYRILAEHGHALCQASSPGHPGPEVATAPFAYLRMHGGPSIEQSDYSRPELQTWGERIRDMLGQGRDVYVYFNNDPRGYAVFNAQYLRSLVSPGQEYSGGTPA